MKKAMQKWLKRHQMTFSVDTANSLCNRFGLDTEKMDGCYMLVADLEADRITQEEFTAGLSVLTGKEPEEVLGILKGVNPPHKRAIPRDIEILVPGDMTDEERVNRWFAYEDARIKAVKEYDENKGKARRDALKYAWNDATYNKAIANAQRIFHEEAEVKAKKILVTPISGHTLR